MAEPGMLATVGADERIIALAVNTLGSEHSKTAYRRSLTAFLDWCPSTSVARMGLARWPTRR